MSEDRIEQAAALLANARQSGNLLDALPDACRPSTAAQAHAVQLATARLLNDAIGGWKVAALPDGSPGRGALLRSRMHASGACLPSALVPLLGIEAEVAFRLDRDLPARTSAYHYDEVAAAVTALPAIEIVDSRLQGYPKPALMDRLADFMSNGAFIFGASVSGWRGIDLAMLDVELQIDGRTIVRQRGGHVTKDPLLPAVALANEMRVGPGLRAGLVVTTGTYTGLQFAKPGQTVIATFHGFGTVQVDLQ